MLDTVNKTGAILSVMFKSWGKGCEVDDLTIGMDR